MNTKSQIRSCTVTLIGKILKPWSDSGIITVPEKREILSNLKYLSAHNELIPVVIPKLLDQAEVAEMLGVSLANFKKLEKKLPFKRKMIGHAVRYRSNDVVRYIFAEDEPTTESSESIDAIQ